jgi:hypothetical protein
MREFKNEVNARLEEHDKKFDKIFDILERNNLK